MQRRRGGRGARDARVELHSLSANGVVLNGKRGTVVEELFCAFLQRTKAFHRKKDSPLKTTTLTICPHISK